MRTKGLTYADLERMFPEEDLVRRELIDGELFLTPSPGFRHQRAVSELHARLHAYAGERGGQALTGPFDVLFDDSNVLEPDVLYLSSDTLARVEERYLPVPPDLAVEVSSPSSRPRDRVGKREVYERHGAPEYWFVDLDADRVEIYRLEEGRYSPPEVRARGERIDSTALAGLSIPVDGVLGAPAA